MGKLHELLAVETSLKGACGKIIQETTKVFKDGTLFQGALKKLEMFAEEDKGSDEITGRLERETTVGEKLEYMRDAIENYFDCVYQKDMANQEAKADIVIDGVTIARDIPATYLLGMEDRLKQLRPIFEGIPTLTQGVKWESSPDDGIGVFRTVEPKVSFKTRKTRKSMIVAAADKNHKAQVEVWDDVENCGKYTETYTSGAITPAEKSQYLKKFDKMFRAIKQARQRANCIDTTTEKIASDLMYYIIG